MTISHKARYAIARDDETHLFPQFWFTLLDGGNKHVTGAGCGQSVQATTDSMDSNNVQVLTTFENARRIDVSFRVWIEHWLSCLEDANAGIS